MAGDVGTVRDHAEAHDVRAERWHRRSTDGGAAGADRGERNWDYRYTWVRDASFSVYALLGMGFTEEAAALGRWLRDRVHEQVGGEGGPLNIMYRVDGSSDLIEEILPHWEGYRGSARSGSGTVPRTSCSSTSTARRSTASTSPTSMDLRPATRDGAASATSWTGSPTTGTSRRRASGRLGAAGRTSPTAG